MIGYHKRAVAHAALNHYEQAMRDWELAIQLNPMFAETYFHRAGVYQTQEQYEKAIEDYNIALQLDPEEAQDVTPFVHMGLGQVFTILGRYQDAIGAYGNAIK